MKHKILFSFLGLSSLIALNACGVRENINHVTASQIARPAFMVERVNDSGGSPLYTWERMRHRGQRTAVYIEGDMRYVKGQGYNDNPVALHLSSRDRTPNLLYLAQPCQYSTGLSESCKAGFTTLDSETMLQTYNAVLDEVKKRYGITGFDLVGHDSGANIAALLAAQRNDILSLRTVAGKLNPAEGLSAAAIAPQLVNVPQHHFLGAADTTVTPATYHEFRQEMGDSECVHYTMVQDADHTRGWVEKWPELLGYDIACAYEPMETYVPAPFPPAPDRRLDK